MELRTRVSDGDRDLVVLRLQQAFADGRLGSAEMEARLELALTAASHGDLLQVTADLPELPDETVELRSAGGRIRRVGDWQVPRRLRIASEYGSVWLDLSRTVIGHPEIEIDLRLDCGSATIVLPRGATANADAVRVEWGSVACRVPGRPRPGAPHLRVTGLLPYGRLRIRGPRQWSGRWSGR
ncbi:DUF1707 domain-containing protein [Nonomuraea sp. NPDC005650]|uniref:DUF1707 SHOCT-like domain-containing protein n=1 Tax=Nonomuraea sp. NPDC005650 TaxID=3157045 RepID=UPI0033B73385